MKVLFLGNSTDAGSYVPAESKATTMLAGDLERLYGQPFEIVTRGIWPDSDLPATVERWMEREHPELVYLGVVGWWMTFESVPLKLQRLLGPLGKPTANLGFRLAETPWIAHTAPFHWGRKLLGRVVGGDPHFTPDEVAESIGQTIRTVLRHEGTTLVVKGPQHKTRKGYTKAGTRRAEARRLSCHFALRELCAEVHVEYIGSDEPMYPTRSNKGMRIGDRLHANERGHQRRRGELLPYLVRACEIHGLQPAETEVGAGSGPS
ncbi:MAG: SGNH/GDSL hydrolase family protein [Dehalococcoidia bacterium]